MASPRSRKPERPPIVVVEWHDSRSLTSRWKDRQRVLDEAKLDYDEILQTAGFLLEVTKRYVIVAGNVNVGIGMDEVSDVIQIPRSEIAAMKVLRGARGGKWKKK